MIIRDLGGATVQGFFYFIFNIRMAKVSSTGVGGEEGRGRGMGKVGEIPMSKVLYSTIHICM